MVAAARHGVLEPEAVRGRPAWDVRARGKRGRHPHRGVGGISDKRGEVHTGGFIHCSCIDGGKTKFLTMGEVKEGRKLELSMWYWIENAHIDMNLSFSTHKNRDINRYIAVSIFMHTYICSPRSFH